MRRVLWSRAKMHAARMVGKQKRRCSNARSENELHSIEDGVKTRIGTRIKSANSKSFSLVNYLFNSLRTYFGARSTSVGSIWLLRSQTANAYLLIWREAAPSYSAMQSSVLFSVLDRGTSFVAKNESTVKKRVTRHILGICRVSAFDECQVLRKYYTSRRYVLCEMCKI